MKCDKCIHRQVCGIRIMTLFDHETCEHYKDEDCMIESPVPMGATVYRVNRWKDGTGFIQPCPVVGLHLRDREDHLGLKREEYLVARPGYGLATHLRIRDIGKSVFLKEEEALAEASRKKVK